MNAAYGAKEERDMVIEGGRASRDKREGGDLRRRGENEY